MDKLDGQGQPIYPHINYYVQFTMPGDNLLFWKPNHSGYTVILEEAGVYLGSDRACQSSREEDVPWPVSLIKQATHTVVSQNKLDDLKTHGFHPAPCHHAALFRDFDCNADIGNTGVKCPTCKEYVSYLVFELANMTKNELGHVKSEEP